MERAGFNLGLVDYASVPYTYFTDSMINTQGINTVFIEVCPPEDGVVNISSWGAFLAAALLKSDSVTKVIGVVNSHYPKADAEDPNLLSIPVERFAGFSENHHPLLTMTESDPEEIDETIASYIMEYLKRKAA